jgi:hypothetical protein
MRNKTANAVWLQQAVLSAAASGNSDADAANPGEITTRVR